VYMRGEERSEVVEKMNSSHQEAKSLGFFK
jgi:hypothetical protein